MGAVGGIVGGVVDMFKGDGESRTTNTGSQAETTQETKLGAKSGAQTAAEGVAERGFGDLEAALSNYFGKAQGDSEQINQLFKSALTKFATGTGQPSPEQLAAATSFVDDTYTNAASTQYNRFLDEAQNRIAGRSAQLGRSSTDVGYQREFASQAGAAAQDIANQRGSLIAQRVDQLPQQQLSALATGSQFFNSPLNNAIQNRLSLLNLATVAQNAGVNQQLATGKTIATSKGSGQTIAPPASWGTRIAGIGSSLDRLGGDAARAYSMMG